MPATNLAARLIEAQPGNILLLLPDAPKYTMVAATREYYQTSNTSPDKLIGKGVFFQITLTAQITVDLLI